MKTAALLLALTLAVPSLGAQAPTSASAVAPEHAAVHAEHPAGCEEYAPGDFITPHITDAHCLDVPGFPRFWEAHEVELPRWEPVMIGGVAIDFSPTKHVVMLLVAALLCCIVLIGAARSHVRHTKDLGRAKGFASGIEAMVLYVRSEVGLQNLGPHGERYAPFILALFFFILFANLLGLIPFGSTATGNVSVTATLAIITFIVVELAGMREQGLKYFGTIFYWNRDLSLPIRIPMFIIMSPIEVVGKIAKPFALTVRLFANMTAGHIVVLALIGLIFTFKSYVLGTAPLLMAVAIMMLEIFVAFLQAYIFALLAAVFIGQIREGAH
jgi:F-type H+-transporting ATPase subunit a